MEELQIVTLFLSRTCLVRKPCKFPTRSSSTLTIVFTLALVLAFIPDPIASTGEESFEGASRVKTLSVSDRGYRDVVVAIADDVKEDEYPTLVDGIKEAMTEASAFMYRATRSLAYFKTVRILLPATWSKMGSVPHGNASWERYQHSDVRVTSRKNNHYPYTEKFTECGRPGRYIAVTADYLVNSRVDGNALHDIYGMPNKVIVHEWGHFRWGLFDEYPRQTPFYQDLETGKIEATRCVRNIPGEILNVQTGQPCGENDLNSDGLPDSSTCVFFDDTDEDDGYSASIMYKQYLSGNEQFCDDPTRPGVPDGAAHNPMAPNEQNDNCQQRSAWEVMRTHPDFEGTESLDPTPVVSTVPEFIVVRQKPATTTVLVLDTSGSMDGERLVLLQQASTNIIENVLPLGSRLGIISFSEYAHVLHNIVEIVSDETRESLLRSLPRNVDGRTSIGRGVELAVEKLREMEDDPAGSTLIVITDGEQNSFPYISDVLHIVEDLTVNTVAVGGEADKDLEQLAMHTGGDSFSHTDHSSEIYLSFFKAAASQISPSQVSEAVIDADFTTIYSQGTVTNNFHLDDALTGGLKITIAYIWSSDPTEVSFAMRRPDGEVYDSNSQPKYYITDSGLKQIKINLPEAAVIAGEWTLNVTNHGNYIDYFNIIIQPRVREGTIPILATAHWAVPEVTPPNRQILFVSVQQGETPVVSAEVSAVVRLNTRSAAAAMLNVTIQPRDDGIGADVTKDDGIYSAYFTSFLGEGRHGVEIQVSSKQDTKLAKGAILGYGAASNPYFAALSDSTVTYESTGKFQREITGGSFECTSSQICGNSSVDVYPPRRITDMSGSRINSEEVVLRFTAPGDDLAQGNASRYEMRYSYNFTEISREFENSEQVPSHWFVAGNVNTPSPAGFPEEFRLTFSSTNATAVIFAVIAIDDKSNRGERSNLVTIHRERPPVPEAQKGLSPGAIAGVTIAMLLTFFTIVVVVVLIRIKRHRAPSKWLGKSQQVSV